MPKTKYNPKIELIKLKMKATGDDFIPTQQRVYFNVSFPKESKQSKDLGMYFSKDWSVGKVVDRIAQQGKIRNDNNTSTSERLHLRLTDTDDDAFEFGITLKELIEAGKLEQGQRLTLERLSL